MKINQFLKLVIEKHKAFHLDSKTLKEIFITFENSLNLQERTREKTKMMLDYLTNQFDKQLTIDNVLEQLTIKQLEKEYNELC